MPLGISPKGFKDQDRGIKSVKAAVECKEDKTAWVLSDSRPRGRRRSSELNMELSLGETAPEAHG